MSKVRSVPIAALSVVALLASLLSTNAADPRYPGALADHRVARGTKGIAEVWLSDATTRYQHFVLGSRYEAASLSARLPDGRIIKLTLPDDQVFEDRQPRLADLDGDGRDEIIVVRSSAREGASLVVVRLIDSALKITTASAPTGRPNTWLNPAGIADFDGDGRLDIAYVQMPHVLGLLRVWTLRDGKLVEIATLPDTSNHAAGSPHLALSAVTDVDGDGVADLVIPSKDRRTLRVLTFKSGAKEIARKVLPHQAIEDFALRQDKGVPVVDVGIGGGRRHAVPLR